MVGVDVARQQRLDVFDRGRTRKIAIHVAQDCAGIQAARFRRNNRKIEIGACLNTCDRDRRRHLTRLPADNRTNIGCIGPARCQSSIAIQVTARTSCFALTKQQQTVCDTGDKPPTVTGQCQRAVAAQTRLPSGFETDSGTDLMSDRHELEYAVLPNCHRNVIPRTSRSANPQTRVGDSIDIED